MAKPEFIARQSAHPTGLFGHVLARVMALDGLVVLQSWSEYVGQYGYVGYGLLGERAAVCVPKLDEEVDIAAVAASFGVSADVAAEDRSERPPDIHAEGERQASSVLAEAAGTLSQHPQALQLRYLQTLTEVATEGTNTILFPLPLDLLKPFLGKDRDD